jgi:hypothetical protein
MSSISKPLEEMIQELPPSLKMEVQVFVESLLAKPSQPVINHKLRQDWGGMLKAEGYNSIELQNLSSQWRDN